MLRLLFIKTDMKRKKPDDTKEMLYMRRDVLLRCLLKGSMNPMNRNYFAG